MILEIKKLNKAYGKNIILDDINLEVKKAETISIVGKSGVGKSTLLKIIASLESYNSGSVKINDVEITKETNSSIGFIFQNFNLFPHLSVKKNIELAPKLVRKSSKLDRNLRTKELLKMLDITDKENEYPSNLSGGEQQRVAIARALATNPKLILFDEPTSALDLESTNKLIETMTKLKEIGILMLIVTHDLSFAKSISDRILLVESKKIVYDSSIESSYDLDKQILNGIFKES